MKKHLKKNRFLPAFDTLEERVTPFSNVTTWIATPRTQTGTGRPTGAWESPARTREITG